MFINTFLRSVSLSNVNCSNHIEAVCAQGKLLTHCAVKTGVLKPFNVSLWWEFPSPWKNQQVLIWCQRGVKKVASVCVAWLRFVYSPRLNEHLIGREGWAELIINACRFHRGIINSRQQSPHTARTVWICHCSGKKRKAKYYFFCLMDTVLTGMFWQGYFSSFSLIALMVCLLSGLKANTNSKCELNILIFFTHSQLFVCHLHV